MSIVPVVLSFTPNYIIPAATVIKSLLDASPSDSRYHIIGLVSSDLDISVQEDLQNIADNRLEVTLINLEGRLQNIHINERFTVAASYRLLLPELLPQYDKVIYVDCDVIIRQNLAELYHNTDLMDNYFAGIFEATLPHQIEYIKNLGCEPGSYINSGFLIINLALQRKDNIGPRLIEASNNPNLIFPDQDAINMVCKGRILGLPPQYNSIRTYFLPQYKRDFMKYYSEEDWQNIQQHGNIHYTGEKPWNAYTVEFDKWWDCYESLPKALKDKYKFTKSQKTEALYRFYKIFIFKYFFLCTQRIYRFLRR